MVYDRTLISTDAATALVRDILGGNSTVTDIRRLHGGMINSVLELSTDGNPWKLVAKLNAKVGHQAFAHEEKVLNWHIRETGFPVPEPYGTDLSGRHFDGSALLMERLPGFNMGEAHLTSLSISEIERQMAAHVARLHCFTRSTYGSALQPESEGKERWLDVFGPWIRSNFEDAAPRLGGTARGEIDHILGRLTDLLPESGRPTLVHGDLWATNIIVDPFDVAGPKLTGFVDGGADYFDAEYELAYLLVFNTAGQAFFTEYASRHELRPGFHLRCRIYWLNTMLLHVWKFGDAHYIENAENLAHALAYI